MLVFCQVKKFIKECYEGLTTEEVRGHIFCLTCPSLVLAKPHCTVAFLEKCWFHHSAYILMCESSVA